MDRDYNEQIGAIIRKYRLLNNLGQEQLATKLGYKNKSSIARIEAGLSKLPVDKLEDFAYVFGISVDDLVSEVTIERHTVSDNSSERMQHILLILAQMNDKQIAKAENILSTIFEED